MTIGTGPIIQQIGPDKFGPDDNGTGMSRTLSVSNFGHMESDFGHFGPDLFESVRTRMPG